MRSVINRGASAVALAVALVSLVPAPPASAQEATPPVSPAVTSATTYGYDVSWPQCNTTLPADRPFAIVGLNKGIATVANPCFENEFAWAKASTGATEQPAAAVYVNTGNPALKAAWWPTANVTRNDSLPVDTSHGTCAHTASSACAYVYGYSIAHDDVTMPTTVLPSGLHWWLDVETSNTWQSDTHANASVLAGMKAYFTSIGDTVGIYSTSYQWKTIVGATSSSSSLAGIPTWLAGASSNTAAAAACANSPLTPGDRVSMVQFVVNNLDRNYSCHQFADAPAPVMSVSGSFGVGKKLTAVTGTWTVNPTSFSYQWLRSGLAISNATKSTYTATSTDGGKQLSVKVTATRRGYTTLAQKSAQVLILKSLTATPVPKITGTAKVGVTLTASAGTWSPSPVTLSYQWNRDGVAISTNATGKTYVPVAGDVGKAITVTVTGSRSGYMSVHHSSPSVTPKA